MIRNNDLNEWKDFVKQDVSKRIKNLRKTVTYIRRKNLNKPSNLQNSQTFLHNFQNNLLLHCAHR